MKKYLALIVIFFSIIISVLILEIGFRVFNLNSNIIYYSSNFYGYYHLPEQNIMRRGEKIFIDKMGNRNNNNNTFQNSNLFFLGDSITYGGSAVSNEETFSFLTSKNLNENYLNISANGWGIDNMLNFVEFYDLYKNNALYVLTCINDCFTRSLRKIEQNFLFEKKQKSAVLVVGQYLAYKFNEYLKLPSQVDIDFSLKDNFKTIKSSLQKLSEFNKKLKSINSKLLIIYSPNHDYLRNLLTKSNYYEDETRNQIFNNLLEQNLKFYDLGKLFNEKELNNFGNFYIDAVHLSEEGHKLYSEIITKIINENK